MFCSKCGQNADNSDSFCSKCGNKLTDTKPTENEKIKEWSSRTLCNDGSCIGVINGDGFCTECQKPYDPNFSEIENSDARLNIKEREKITVEREKQKKSSKNVWLFFIAAILVLGYFGKNNTHTTENNRNQSQYASNTSSPTITNNNVANENEIVINEKAALQNSYFGNFKNGKIQKKSGTINLEVAQDWIKYVRTLPQQYQSVMSSDTQHLNTDYDEIWTWEDDEGLSKKEKKKYKGQLKLYKLYWKNGKVQASTLEELKYNTNPVTGANLSTSSYKITMIFDRDYILKKLREK